MSAPMAFGSSSAVEMSSSRLIELDMEHMRHMGAAVAQQLHNRGFILNRIEMRLHGLRLRRYLAQGERGREKLDQYGSVHEDCGRAAGFEERNDTTAIIAI